MAYPGEDCPIPRHDVFGRPHSDEMLACLEAAKIRRRLQDPCYAGVKMTCFNEKEADLIRSFLTPEERERASFSWYFGGPPDGA